MMRSLKSAWALAFVLAQSCPAFAQFLDQNRADRNPPAQPAAQAPVASPKAAAPRAIKPFVLTAVQVSGASVPPQLIGDAAQPFIGKTIGADGIDQITNAISSAYGRSQVALYTVVAPGQDFAGGVLRLVVQEGYIENVDLQGVGIESRDLDLVKAYAARLTAEHPLSRATLQRYVSLIRDIPGLKPDVQLYTGNAPGAVRMVIKLDQKDYDVTLGLNNNGNPLLGRTQMEMDLTGYGLLREGEKTTLSYGTATDTGRYQFVSLADAEPLDDDGTLAQATGAYLHTKTKGLDILGDAETIQLLVSHPLIRSYDENLTVTGDLDGLNSSNALLGQTLANERVRAIRVAGSYSLQSDNDLLSANATFSNGLGGLGAHVSLPDTAVTDFHKFNASLGYNRLLFGPEWVIRLKATTQLADAPLPASELFSLGGTDYGRAFPLATAIGDSAVAGSAEFAWRPANVPFDFLKGSEAYVFYDDGETWFRRRGVASSGTVTLASAGFGARLAVFEKDSLGVELARQLDVPPGFRHDWVVNLAIKALQ